MGHPAAEGGAALNEINLTGRELDMAIEKEFFKPGYVCTVFNNSGCSLGTSVIWTRQEPSPYSSDIAAAWQVEEKIARTGLHEVYGQAVFDALDTNIFTVSYFDLLHASPEIRCRAALTTVRQAKAVEEAKK